MTRKNTLAQARKSLDTACIPDSSLEAELLLRHILAISRAELFGDLAKPLTPDEQTRYHEFVKRRLNGEPSAYITGHREFYGLDFIVTQDVLIPRPESELLVDEALKWLGAKPEAAIADVGTGSGAIAVSLAVNLPQIIVYAGDISKAALRVARANAARHGVTERVRFLGGDLLAPFAGKLDLVTANLPYVSSVDMLSVNTNGYEPGLALDGGIDGLDKIRTLCRQAREKLAPGGCLLMEIGQGQGEAVTDLLWNLFPLGEIALLFDLAGIERVVRLTLKNV